MMMMMMAMMMTRMMMMLRLDWDQRPPAAKSDGELYLRNCQGILGGHVLSQTGDDGGDDDGGDDDGESPNW